MLPAGFEPAFPASQRPQTHALDRAATGIGMEEPYTDKLKNTAKQKRISENECECTFFSV